MTEAQSAAEKARKAAVNDAACAQGRALTALTENLHNVASRTAELETAKHGYTTKQEMKLRGHISKAAGEFASGLGSVIDEAIETFRKENQ